MKCTAQDMIDAMREAFTISRKCHLDELISLQSGISASVTHLAYSLRHRIDSIFYETEMVHRADMNLKHLESFVLAFVDAEPADVLKYVTQETRAAMRRATSDHTSFATGETEMLHERQEQKCLTYDAACWHNMQRVVTEVESNISSYFCIATSYTRGYL